MPIIRPQIDFRRRYLTGHRILDISQVGYWPFDKDDGNYARDRSGYNNHGTIYGATRAAGKVGDARNFDGVDDYIQTPYFNIFNQKPFTVMGWILCRASKEDEVLFASGDVETTDRYLHLLVRNGVPILGFYGDDLISTTTLSLNSWIHLAFVWEGPATKKQIIYVNGVYDSSRTSAGLITVTSGAATGKGSWIGRYILKYHDGLIDEVRIYNRALSQAEIQRIMNMRGL